LCPQSALIFINEAFVGRDDACATFNQSTQMVDVVRAGGQQRVVRNHPTAGDSQPQLEAVIIQLFRRAVTIVGEQLEAPITRRARVSANG
jgi:hypothetical protein